MRKIIILTLLVLCQYSWAGIRPEAKMRKIAASKLLANAKDASRLKILETSPAYYIYGREEGGFVVVSTNDQQTGVLGYSSSTYKADNLPPAFKCWLKAIEEIDIQEPTSVSYTPVPNFLSCQWGQGDPFNYLCPEVSGSKTPSGCVATAMSQIMYYYKYPTQGTGSGYYTVGASQSRITENISGVYQWGNMLDKYTDATITDEMRISIATLLKDAGLGAHMNYNAGGSGASSFDAAPSLINNFGYDPYTMHMCNKEYYSNDEWSSLIYEELAARRPILAAGSDPTEGGHAFIFSGVDEDGKIYVNWGWNGDANGFYEITALNPHGIHGSNNNPMAFNMNNQIICGIQPSPETPDITQYRSEWVSDSVFAAEPWKIRNYLKIKTKFVYNQSMLPFTGTISLYFKRVDGDTSKDKMYSYMDLTQESVLPGYGYSSSTAKNITTNDLEPGDYYIYLVSQATDETKPQRLRHPGGLYQFILTKNESGYLSVNEYEPTGISAVSYTTDTFISTRIFDLRGRSMGTDLNALPKGIYIINGKKVVK
jgi:hypothetical protein